MYIKQSAIMLYLSMILLSFSCKNFNESYSSDDLIAYATVEKVLHELLVFPNAKINSRIFMVIPYNNGCKTCTYKALDYYEKNKNYNNQLHFTFTDLTSQKSITARFGKAILSATYVVIDKNNTFFRNGLELEYPLIIYIKNRKITNIEVCSSNNFQAYDELSVFLSNK